MDLFSVLAPNRVEMGVVGLGPAGEGYFLAGVELDAFVALDVQVAEERPVPAGEREPCHRGGDADVDADHAGVEVAFEMAGGVAASSEDGGSVAVFGFLADGQCFVEVGGPYDREHGTEDFFFPDAHFRTHTVDDARAQEKAIGVEFLAAIERNARAFALRDIQITCDSISMVRANDRTHIDVLVAVGRTDSHLPGVLDKVFDNRITRFSNRDRDAAGHTPLTGAAERRCGQRFYGLIYFGIRHDHYMVFCAAGRLDAFARCRSPLVDVLRNTRGTDKGNRGDFRMIKQRINAFAIAVDNVDNAVGSARFCEQLAKSHSGKRHLFRWLQYERVAARKCDGEHPQRHHEGEVVRRNADANADGVADRFRVDVTGNIRQDVARDEARDSAGEFDDLDAAVYFGPCFGERLAMLARDKRGELFEVLFQNCPEAKHQPGAFDDGRFAPRRQRCRCRFDNTRRFIRACKRYSGDHLTGGGIVNFAGTFCPEVGPFAAGKNGDGFNCRGSSGGHVNSLSADGVGVRSQLNRAGCAYPA